MSAPAEAARRPVATRDEAELLMAALTAALAELEGLLERETALIGAGRLRDGLAEAPTRHVAVPLGGPDKLVDLAPIQKQSPRATWLVVEPVCLECARPGAL